MFRQNLLKKSTKLWFYVSISRKSSNFTSEKTMLDFYSSILGIPVAGATLPVLAFLLLAIYGKNFILGVAVLILGIGHIGIHLMHKKEIES